MSRRVHFPGTVCGSKRIAASLRLAIFSGWAGRIVPPLEGSDRKVNLERFVGKGQRATP